MSETGRRSESPLGLDVALLIFGALWGVALAALFASRATDGVARLAALLSRTTFFLLLGLVHGAALALVARFVGASGVARRFPRLATLALVGVTSIVYALFFLSAIKFAIVGAHLRFEDFWFLSRSVLQLSAETTPEERAGLVFALLLPFGLAGLILGLRRVSRGRWSLETKPLARLFVVGAVGAAIVAIGHAGAREAAVVIAPDSRLLASPPAPQGSEVMRHNLGAGGRAIVPYVPEAGSRRSNVLVVMLESIPWARLFGPEARPGSTPRLDALTRESVVFDRAYATSTHSDYAQTSILASLHPRKFEGHDYFRDLDYPRTLFWDPLVPLGWRSAVFSCQNENWGNMIAFLATPNLGLLRHAPDWPRAERRGAGSESKVFEATPIDAFFEWLDAEPERPFAVYLNFQATHYPYVVPAGYPVPFRPSEINFPTTFLSYPLDKIPVMENRFHNALAYVDESVGRVVDGLAARGLLDRTALLVVSDHGEAFYEHGLPTHGTTLLEEQVRTAMLLRLPGVAPARIEESVSVLDAIPTIYRWMGLPRHGNFQGRDDVLEPGYSAAGRPLPMTIQGMTREDGLLLDGWKYLVNWDRREKALFDLSSDPDERRNLAAVRPQELERLDASLRDLIGRQLRYYRARGWERGRYPPPLP